MFEVILRTREAGSNKPQDEWTFDDELDDESEYEWNSPSARIMLICQRLQVLKALEFIVVGFGPEPWDLEISYDFSMVMENLPDFLEWMDKGGEDVFQQFLYAYGAARTLSFKVNEGQVQIECKPNDNTYFQPDPEIELSDINTLDEMFTRILNTFVSETLHHFPEEIKDQYFMERMNSPSIKSRLENQ